jgi:preprotein translocase subunit YajC
MSNTSMLLGQAAGAPNPLEPIVLMLVMMGIFYVVLILPARRKQRKLEDLVKALQPGDRVVLNSGILGTVAAVEGDTLQLRVDDRTRLRVLRSAVAGLQANPQTDNPEKK